MSKDILPFYEREHSNVALLIREFAEQYPQLASVLGIIDGVCEDPSVLRIIEALVMMGARILQQLEDSYPQFTDTLLNVNYPHYTRPFPSTSIARVDYDGADTKTMSTVTTIPRGALLNSLEHKNVICQFRTTYPVTIAPMIISRAEFFTHFRAPPALRLPVEASTLIDIVIEGTCATLPLDRLALPSLRVFIDGDPSLRATLQDTLMMRAVRAYVEANDDGQWHPLKGSPLASAGYADDEALIPFKATSHPAYRLISEYFTYPAKFNFIDIDLASIRKELPPDSQQLTLHLAIVGIGADSDIARVLKPLSNKNLLLSCTPVVNLFKRAASPIDLTQTKAEYPLIASAEQAAAFEIHSVDAVHVVRDTPKGSTVTQFYPYYSMRHGLAGDRKGHYWHTRRDSIIAQTSPGYETHIALTDIDLNPLALETATISAELTCTNRDLPNSLRVGQANGDLKLERAPANYPIRLLRKPTPTYRFPAEAHWRLISLLALNHHSLVQQDLDAFTEMLTLHNLPQSAVQQHQIKGIVGLAYRRTRVWLKDAHGGGRVSGIEVHLTIDEDAFVGSGLHSFIQVMDRFLGLYADLNSFTQLIVFSTATGKEIARCNPRSGDSTIA
ncbi:type VI secretion system baseplate subunit TssF [Rugamonas rubra]|uniref:Type VI secretion system protein ImpG n=1 Tax=Rugamonas rubra TaxID=758825 RepID=A0A1I4NTS9_9BURK|nr:type VI secretion system baseplate subunit TssF [Rugamonas rubra]SFM18697.1 type VI secretion system protein ImpG [Rugamonas rubra]